MRQADHAAHHVRGDGDRHFHRPDARGDLRAPAFPQPARGGVLGMDQQGAALGALHQPLAVVHPGVVAAEGAPPDQDQVTVRRRPLQRRREPIEIAQEEGRRELQPPSGKTREKLRLQRPEVQSVRVLLELPERDAVRAEAQ
jgi:hypothetical protein